MNNSLHGDPTLLNTIPGISSEDFLWHELKQAYCWDAYGLPDGYKGPKGVLMAPFNEALTIAFDELLSQLIIKEDQWVIKIPRKFVNMNSLNAKVLSSTDYGVALLLPRGMLYGFFYWNELFWELKLGESSKLPKECKNYARKNLSEILNHWMLCGPISNNISNLEFEMSHIRRVLHPDDKQFIWSKATTQQAFILLHELGHILDAQKKCSYLKPDELFNNNSRNELMADIWVIDCLKKRGSILDKGGINEVFESILVLFSLIEFLQRKKLIENFSVILWRKRFYQFMEIWSEVGNMKFNESEFQSYLRILENFLICPRNT